MKRYLLLGILASSLNAMEQTQSEHTQANVVASQDSSKLDAALIAQQHLLREMEKLELLQTRLKEQVAAIKSDCDNALEQKDEFKKLWNAYEARKATYLVELVEVTEFIRKNNNGSTASANEVIQGSPQTSNASTITLNEKFKVLASYIIDTEKQKDQVSREVDFINKKIASGEVHIEDFGPVRAALASHKEQLASTQGDLLAEMTDIADILKSYNTSVAPAVKNVPTSRKHEQSRQARVRKLQIKQGENEIINKLMAALTINGKCERLDRRINNFVASFALAFKLDSVEKMSDFPEDDCNYLAELRDDLCSQKQQLMIDINAIFKKLGYTKNNLIELAARAKQKLQEVAQE